MKKFLFAAGVIFALFIAGCEVEPPAPDCEVYGWGDVTIKNKTGFYLWVDCTKYIDGVNYEKRLSNNGSQTYREMDDGRVYIWASFDGDDWLYDTYSLDACEDLEYTWYLDKKKSTGSGLVLEIRDGDEVHTITDFEHYDRNQ